MVKIFDENHWKLSSAQNKQIKVGAFQIFAPLMKAVVGETPTTRVAFPGW